MQALDGLVGIGLALVTFPVGLATSLVGRLPPESAVASAIGCGLVFAALGGRGVRPALVLVPLTAAIGAEHGVGGLVMAGALAGLLRVLFGAFGVARMFAAAPVAAVRALSSAAAIAALSKLLTLAAPAAWPPHPPAAWSVELLGLLPFAFALALTELGGETRATSLAHGLGAGLIALAVPLHFPRAVVLALLVALAVHALAAPGRPRSRRDALYAGSVLLLAAAFGFGFAVAFTTALALVSFARASSMAKAPARSALAGSPR